MGAIGYWGLLLPPNSPPLVRSDYTTVVDLASFLRANAPHEPLYVIAASPTLNADTLRQAEQQAYGRSDIRLYFLASPDIDSRDFYPLDSLVQAQYVILGTPLQIEMDVNQQKVVKAAYDAFAQDWAISQDFVRLPRTLELKGGVKVSLYHRIRPTSLPVLLDTLRLVESEVGRVPGRQAD